MNATMAAWPFVTEYKLHIGENLAAIGPKNKRPADAGGSNILTALSDQSVPRASGSYSAGVRIYISACSVVVELGVVRVGLLMATDI